VRNRKVMWEMVRKMTKRQREEQRKRNISKEKLFTVLNSTVINITDISFMSLK